MHIFSHLRAGIFTALDALEQSGQLPAGLARAAITAEPPKDPTHGDIATNAAMVLAKPAGMNPRALAELLLPHLQSLPNVTAASIAGPGFINITLANSVWQNMVPAILQSGIAYGSGALGTGTKVNVEYVSANPTGPMHIGHARGAVVGDVLARLLHKAGYDVTKEYYINDAGAQVNTLARSGHLRYREALGENIGEIPAGLYPGEYLKKIGADFAAKHGAKYQNAPEADYIPVLKPFAIARIMDLIREDLAMLGVQHDVFTSEQSLIDRNLIETTIAQLHGRNLVYTGVLEPPKGKTPEDWEAREQLLFRATDFGDDVDRPLKKSDGSTTYFAGDIAYHADKLSRGFNSMFMCLGADHGGYVKRMKAIVKALSNDTATMEIIIFQLVNLLDGGVPLKMSKRAGRIVSVRDVVETVGKDVLRFMMLTRKADATLDFDLVKVLEQSKDNPVFYVQYAHARSHSVLRKAQETMGLGAEAIDNADVTLLTHPAELALIKLIAQWPRIVEMAAHTAEPHRIAFYLQDLAAALHGLWSVGKDADSIRFIVEENRPLTQARLALISACATTIASGLDVMGVDALTQM